MPLTLRIIHPDQELFKGEVEYVLAPGVKNTLGLMPGHTPMFAELKKGEVEVKRTGGTAVEKIPLEGGILRIRDDKAIILASLKKD